MGGPVGALLGLLCLLAGALLSGFAQEVSTIQSVDLTESPLVATSPPTVSSAHPQELVTSVSAVEEDTPRADTEGEAATDHHMAEDSSTIAELESTTATPTVIIALQADTTDSAVTSHSDVKARETTGPNLTQPAPTTNLQGMGDILPETTNSHTVGPLYPSTALVPGADSPLSTESPPASAQPETTSSIPQPRETSASTTSQVITTTLTTIQSSSSATLTTATAHATRTAVQRDPSGLEVGDKDLPSMHSGSSSNPLFVMIVSVFTIMVVIVVVAVGFHRYKKRNRRTEFRRLQDLPMDDMMEDTPLSLYSY